MSEQIQNGWQPRKEITKKLKSGNECILQRPGPELALHTSQLQRTFQSLRKLSKTPAGKPLDEVDEEQASEEQRKASLDVMRATVAACVKGPKKLHLNPQPGQVGVDDIPVEDFLEIYAWWKAGCPDEEVTAEQADNFPAEQAAGVGAGDSGDNVRSAAKRVGKANKRKSRR